MKRDILNEIVERNRPALEQKKQELPQSPPKPRNARASRKRFADPASM